MPDDSKVQVRNTIEREHSVVAVFNAHTEPTYIAPDTSRRKSPSPQSQHAQSGVCARTGALSQGSPP